MNKFVSHCLLAFISLMPHLLAQPMVDVLAFGDAASEAAHGLASDRSEIIKGGLGESARRFLPPETKDYRGGSAHFKLRVDGSRQNFLTVRLWGDDASQERLVLFCEGKQLGYQHLGDIEVLDTGSEEKGYNGRFYYKTQPLPMEMTMGKTELNCEIRGYGRVWGYGSNFEQFQREMNEPTRGIYKLYVHDDGFFVPPADEPQGQAPAIKVREQPGAEVLEEVRQRMLREVKLTLQDKRPLGQLPLHFLARGWYHEWMGVAKDKRTPGVVAKGLDELWTRYQADPKMVEKGDPSVYNSEWFGAGFAGDVIRLLAEPLAKELEQEIDEGNGGKVKRRVAWCDMLVNSRDWLRHHRRSYTNQTMIIDMNIYRMNRGIAALDSARALPEAAMLRYLHEAAGLVPWLGSETEHRPDRRLGDDYLQLTKQGLTKELGFVGYYGEVLDWMTELYESTRIPGQEGDPLLKAQLVKAAKARAFFRYPAVDADGFRAMRAETVVGWRDDHFPGDVTYGQRDTWDASALGSVAVTLDSDLIGYAQQMLEDNQYFQMVVERAHPKDWRGINGLLEIIDAVELIKKQPVSKTRLPMTPGQPDFAWVDAENAVVAVKLGDERIYASLYWRSRNAVNALARIHYLAPRYSVITTMPEEVEFPQSGQTWKRPNWTAFGFANGGHKYPDKIASAMAGEVLPIAKVPDGIAYKVGEENIFAGKASFYVLHYGGWIMAVNTTKTETFTLKPVGGSAAMVKNLVTGAMFSSKEEQRVGPLGAVVVKLVP